MEELLSELKEQLQFETLNESTRYEKQIINNYYKIIDIWLENYELYREHFAHLLNFLERNFNKSISYSITIFLNQFSQALNCSIESKFSNEILNIEYSDKSIENLKSVLELKDSKQTVIRISDNELNTNHLSTEEIKEIISLIIGKLNQDAEIIMWDLNQVELAFLDLANLRELCLKVNEPELFYHASNVVIDRLFTSEYHQEARDICEEILIASIKDNFSYYGFFICFRVYSNQANIQAALLYGNLFLKSIINYKLLSSDRFQFEIIWQSLKLFRNCGLFKLAIDIYESTPDSFSFSIYQRHSLANSYFSCRMLMKDKSVTSSLYDYLNKERENILSEGVVGCIPWLLALYNLKRLKQIFDFENSGLNQYLVLFEPIVPNSKIENLKNIVFGNSDELKKQLKESLLKLTRTRNKSDFVYDNEMSLKIASRLIESSFKKKDIEAILLAMLIKSDYSINVLSKQSKGLAPIDITEINHETFYDDYENPIQSVESFPLESMDLIIWLINSEDKLFQLTHKSDEYLLNEFIDWDLINFQKWSRNKVPNLDFDTTTKDRYGSVISYVKEDFDSQSEIIKKDITFPKIFNTSDKKRIFVIKDMAISELPHNLLLGENNELLGLSASITNILSVEWLNLILAESKNITLKDKSIYIPTQGGDLTINMLFELIKDTLEKNNVAIQNSITEISPLDSIINIFSSHGNRNISTTNAFYPDDKHVINNLNGILGKGKILILLVCHSGSEKGMLFRNEIASVIKKYLSDGYEAVIAPFWSLHINIPPIWLPVFFETIDKGMAVCDAVSTANKSVYESYPTPSAWACMHLYGNPFFHIQKDI